jgi:hypothetical protein
VALLVDFFAKMYMGIPYDNLDLDILERLYQSRSKELEKELLSGASWDEVKMKREQLNRLSSALHEKLSKRIRKGDPASEKGE